MSIYLSLYLSRGGVCARRKAIELIKDGEVSVNGTVVTDPSTQVNEHDKVVCMKRRVIIAQPIHVLLNKPKGIVTSCADEKNRMTVVDLIKIKQKNVRLYPVGRLDKDTTGLLLLTNDGQWAQRLAHPKYRVQKGYTVTLNKPLSPEAFDRLKRGIHLYDGKFVLDRIYFPRKNNRRVINLTIHSGKYRIIRRAFESLDYKVAILDRQRYGSLSLAGVPRGSWRELSEKEITALTAEKKK